MLDKTLPEPRKTLPEPLFVFELANNHMGDVEHGLRIISEFGALARDYDALLSAPVSLPGGRESVPTPDHYDPLLYVLGAAHAHDAPSVLFDSIQNGSISMLSLGFGLPA